MSLADELFRSLNGNTSPSKPTTPWGFKPVQQPQPAIGGFFTPLVKVPKRKVFISYHHKDQAYINDFRTRFGSAYEVFTDCSLDAAIESNDLHYVNRTIREEFITGTSITIVICGTETWRRKCVDWEIYSTLHKDHALLGILLPHVQPVFRDGQQVRLIPDRLHSNFESGYAHCIELPQNPQQLTQAINSAIQRSSQNKHLKNNSLSKMARNI